MAHLIPMSQFRSVIAPQVLPPKAERPKGIPITEEQLGALMAARVRCERAGRAVPVARVVTGQAEPARARSPNLVKASAERTERANQNVLAAMADAERIEDIARNAKRAVQVVRKRLADLERAGRVHRALRGCAFIWRIVDGAATDTVGISREGV